jgi:hypothetical protein
VTRRWRHVSKAVGGSCGALVALAVALPLLDAPFPRLATIALMAVTVAVVGGGVVYVFPANDTE